MKLLLFLLLVVVAPSAIGQTKTAHIYTLSLGADLEQYLDWLTENFVYLGKVRIGYIEGEVRGERFEIREKRWKQKGTGKLFSARQLVNQFIYEDNECMWDEIVEDCNRGLKRLKIEN